MKRFLAILGILCLIFGLPACSGTPKQTVASEPIALASSQIGKPTLDAFKAMGFQNPEEHVSDEEVKFYLLQEDGVELCGKTGDVLILHSDADNTSVLDNPETTSIQYVFPFEDPTVEDYAFALDLYGYLRETLGDPEEPTGYTAFADMSANDFAASAGSEPTQDRWLVEDGAQISLSAIHFEAGSSPSWLVTIRITSVS